MLEGIPRGGKKGRTLGEAKKPKKVMAIMAKRANNINNASHSSNNSSSSGLLRPEGSNSVGAEELRIDVAGDGCNILVAFRPLAHTCHPSQKKPINIQFASAAATSLDAHKASCAAREQCLHRLALTGNALFLSYSTRTRPFPRNSHECCISLSSSLPTPSALRTDRERQQTKYRKGNGNLMQAGHARKG